MVPATSDPAEFLEAFTCSFKMSPLQLWMCSLPPGGQSTDHLWSSKLSFTGALDPSKGKLCLGVLLVFFGGLNED